MSTLELRDADVDRCVKLAEVLIPDTGNMPALTSLPSFEGLLRSAVLACGFDDELILEAIESLPADLTWDTVKKHATDDAEHFHITSVLVSAAYYMAPQVLAALSYPVNRRHPARADEFAEEFDTGILDSIMEREPMYRDPRQTQSAAPQKHQPNPDVTDAIYPAPSILKGES